MMPACYVPSVEQEQHDRLTASQARVEAATTAYETARLARNGYLVQLRRAGVSVSTMARTIGLTRGQVQRIVSEVSGPPGGLGVARGVHPDAEQTEQLRALQDAVASASAERDAAWDARSRLWIVLESEGVGAVSQAEVLDINRTTIQDVVDAHRRAVRLGVDTPPTDQ